MNAVIKPEVELFKAVQAGSLERVKLLLEQHPSMDINYVPNPTEVATETYDSLIDEGNTALLYALSAEKLEIAKVLLEHNADPCKSNKYNLNALHMLTMVNHDIDQNKINLTMTLLTMLLNNKSLLQNINQEAQYDKRSPLATAIAYLPLTLAKQVIPQLTKHGAKYKGEDPMWSQVIDRRDYDDAIQMIESFFPEQLATSEFLKPSPRFEDKAAIHAAIIPENVAFLNLSLKKLGQNAIELMNNPKLPALQVAINREPLNQTIIEILLDAGADPNVVHIGTKKSFSQRLKELTQIERRQDARDLDAALQKRAKIKASNNG